MTPAPRSDFLQKGAPYIEQRILMYGAPTTPVTTTHYCIRIMPCNKMCNSWLSADVPLSKFVTIMLEIGTFHVDGRRYVPLALSR